MGCLEANQKYIYQLCPVNGILFQLVNLLTYFVAVNKVKETNPMVDDSFHNQVDQPRINSQRRYYHWFLVALYAVFVKQIKINEVKEINPMEGNSFHNQVDQPRINSQRRYHHWLLVALYTVFVLVGNSASTLLGRLYYEKGGKSKWMATLVQHVGFPILLPCYCILAPKNTTRNSFQSKQPSASVVAFIYISYGLCEALICYFFSLGLWYLPVSTYALVCSSQLAFNAFFSLFLNSLKLTPYIINSLLLLTISSTLLLFQTEIEHSTEVSKKNHVIGLVCTVAASAGEGLVLSLVQLAFEKVLKKETSKAMLDMIVFESLVATCVTLVGLFASGEWKVLQAEMEEFETGKTSYLLNLTFAAINWKLLGLGCMGLIFEVSSLFSNAVAVLSLPIVPILAVFIFHEKMNGIEAISIVLAIWGFISYIYQYYLDGSNSNTENRNTGHVPCDQLLNL